MVRKSSSKQWVKTLRLIPGYDPFRLSESFWFDEDAADLVIGFFSECLHHVEGSFVGQPLTPEPWQKAILANLFGWKEKATGRRRYREALIYVPRKNGKTTIVGGIVNYVMFCDQEAGAQIYLAAAERDQASLCFNIASQMAYAEPELAKRCDVYPGRKSMVLKPQFCTGKPSEVKAISADAHTKHGFNVHMAIVDELHAQPNRELVDVLQTGTVSRTQPLMIHVTTSDFERPSICNEKHEYAGKVRDGIIDDARFLPCIWEATLDDDWKSPKTWKKANPNYGVSVTEEYLKRECLRAVESPAYENTFKRLHLNIKTEQDIRLIPMDQWDASDSEPPDLTGKLCYAGLDLASTSDIAAFVMAFPGDPIHVMCKFWIPLETAKKRDREARVPYLQWINQGFIQRTEGDATDYDVIRKEINELRQKYLIKEIAFDPWNATQLANQLSLDGFEPIKFSQSMGNMSEPTKKLLRLLATKGISFGRNPVLRWMASNVSAHEDSTGNIRPDKKKSTEKIDGIVSLVMALGRWIAQEGTKPSVYEHRGLVTL